MPGDPLRAQFIAQTYLKDPILVNNVRGIQGYTGTTVDELLQFIKAHPMDLN
jgi:purine-nucleoside phosphorylase